MQIWPARESRKKKGLSRKSQTTAEFWENFGQANGESMSQRHPSEDSYFPQRWFSTNILPHSVIWWEKAVERWRWHSCDGGCGGAESAMGSPRQDMWMARFHGRSSACSQSSIFSPKEENLWLFWNRILSSFLRWRIWSVFVSLFHGLTFFSPSL